VHGEKGEVQSKFSRSFQEEKVNISWIVGFFKELGEFC